MRIRWRIRSIVSSAVWRISSLRRNGATRRLGSTVSICDSGFSDWRPLPAVGHPPRGKLGEGESKTLPLDLYNTF